MSAFRKKRVFPTNDANERKVSKVRKNGWSLPMHPLQVTAWIFYVIFSVMYYGIMIPMLPTATLRWSGAISTGVMFIFHLIIHVISVSMNPADINLIEKYNQNKKSRKKLRPNVFDRTKHAHVIENQFCYICEVTVNPKSKHCSVCNKCVSDFDHHCKWLNNCVGGRNYRLFIGCVITAVIACFIISALAVVLIVAFFRDDSWLYGNHCISIAFELPKRLVNNVK